MTTASELGPLLERHIRRARTVSRRMVALQREGRLGYHTASIGCEATIVGAVLAAGAADWIFPGARDWYAALARGLPIEAYVHHVLTSALDPARGHALPDHLSARALNVVPPSGVPGAHLPQAVGAAWAAKIRKDAVRVVALFGAEVLEGGDAHNALNFAGVFKAPVVFVCRSAPGDDVRARAVAYGLASVRIDGTDAAEVHATVTAALERREPVLVEAVLPKELADDELEGDAETAAELDAALARVEEVGDLPEASIFDHVFARVPQHLAEQRREQRQAIKE